MERMPFFVVIIFAIVLGVVIEIRRKKTSYKSISENSYTRYARFMGHMEQGDPDFDIKIKSISNLILNKKYEDIKEIASISKCTYEECIMKIMYLKNKRIIGDYYLDTVNGIIKKCSPEDKKLLDKFKVFIYNKHAQIDEIAKFVDYGKNNLKDAEEKVYKELKYLIDKKLLNGVIINEVDRKLVYYSIEKRKKNKDTVSISCPSCGALNDINRSGKKRCDYCDYIIEDDTLVKI